MQREFAAIRDMLDAARNALRLTLELDATRFRTDERTQLAVAHLIMIIGEAANRTSPQVRELYGDVPWDDARDMRNVIVHEYEKVDAQVIWDTVHTDLPPLIEQLVRILDEST